MVKRRILLGLKFDKAAAETTFFVEKKVEMLQMSFPLIKLTQYTHTYTYTLDLLSF